MDWLSWDYPTGDFDYTFDADYDNSGKITLSELYKLYLLILIGMFHTIHIL